MKLNRKARNDDVFTTEIKNKEQIATYMLELYKRSWYYHFDDDATDIQWEKDIGVDPQPSKKQCKLMNDRTQECQRVDAEFMWECAEVNNFIFFEL